MDVVNFFVSHDQKHNNLGLAKPKLLHFSEVTNEITPFASASWRSENLGCQNTADKKSAPRESGKSTQQRVVFSNACDFPVHVTGTPVELG
jgi:hypothetical protein